ncbi:hypothetical protein CPB83DRAFT_366683 [Crepidotus variabilis]|uniref:Uncharacterized protein n=1 Tax=Crepidotus variabilis TaxID=179855 RepID=A0A9P6EFQ5_9AGAR|nr:hypothetical protein CPB83DRAFT_366683 [Crepidotus variabilis]
MSSSSSLTPARISLSVALSVLSSLPLASGYSWAFSAPPSQCQELTINISGDGKPPYRALLVPSGPSPLANNIEARKILDIAFNGTSKSLSFKLAFPANSQFVTVPAAISYDQELRWLVQSLRLFHTSHPWVLQFIGKISVFFNPFRSRRQKKRVDTPLLDILTTAVQTSRRSLSQPNQVASKGIETAFRIRKGRRRHGTTARRHRAPHL